MFVRMNQNRELCSQCNLPLIELDAYGERLRGCVECNKWQSLGSGEWRRLLDDDLIALKGNDPEHSFVRRGSRRSVRIVDLLNALAIYEKAPREIPGVSQSAIEQTNPHYCF
jgi:hypothetical protein